ncbi:hypothetical protein QQ045_014615 [Rhodiola kirilowii]
MQSNNSVGEAPRVAIESLAPISSFSLEIDDQGPKCHGFFHDAVLVAASSLFLIYLGYGVRRNVKRLVNGRSWVMISYYVLLWAAGLLNLAWCVLQTWQCSPGKETSWNQLSLFTTSAMLCLEISLIAFLLQENYASGLESLIRTFTISGIVVVVDTLFKALCVFAFNVPLFMNIEDSSHKGKWILLAIHELVLASVYGYIAFVHYSKWREKLPPRPAFDHYIMAMFGVNAAIFFACLLALLGAGFGFWLFSVTVVVYHSFYLPLLYTTFLADFFQEQEFLLDNAYYAEMRDAGFFDADWD